MGKILVDYDGYGEGNYVGYTVDVLRSGVRFGARGQKRPKKLLMPGNEVKKMVVDCGITSGGVLENVPMERVKDGSGYVWKCNGRCDKLNKGDDMEGRLGYVIREIRGIQQRVFGVVDSRVAEPEES